VKSSIPSRRWTRPPEARLTDEQFAALTETLGERTGLLFPPEKRREFEVKLSGAIAKLDPPSRDKLIGDVGVSRRALQKVVNQLTVGESYFFRNRPHFHALEERIIPDLIERRRSERSLRIWSAGCATGEEPYSLSILLRDRFPELADWDVRIIATDINTAFLDRAQRAVYSAWSFRGVEQELIDRYFERLDGGEYELDQQLKESVDFRWFNLAEIPLAGRIALRQFDLVLCRNVLIYFSFDFANSVVDAMIEVIAPGGYFLVGHAEAFPALGSLEANFSSATYYYRQMTPGERAATTHPPGRTLSIPGIGVGTLYPVPSRVSLLTEAGASYLAELSDRGQAERDSIPPPPTPEQLLVEAELERAKQLADAAETDGALEVLEGLAQGAGGVEPRVYFLMALVSDQSGNLERAVSCVKKAIFLDKTFTIAHYFHGVISEREGDDRTAARCFRNVLSLVEREDADAEIDEAGGLTAGRLRAIATERVRELGRS